MKNKIYKINTPIKIVTISTNNECLLSSLYKMFYRGKNNMG